MERYLIFIETNIGANYQNIASYVILVNHSTSIYYVEDFNDYKSLETAESRWFKRFERFNKELISIYDIHIERNI